MYKSKHTKVCSGFSVHPVCKLVTCFFEEEEDNLMGRQSKLFKSYVDLVQGCEDPSIKNLKQEPIVSLLRRSTIKRNLEITMYYVHFVLVHGSFVAVVIWKILLVQVESI